MKINGTWSLLGEAKYQFNYLVAPAFLFFFFLPLQDLKMFKLEDRYKFPLKPSLSVFFGVSQNSSSLTVDWLCFQIGFILHPGMRIYFNVSYFWLVAACSHGCTFSYIFTSLQGILPAMNWLSASFMNNKL